MSATAAGEIILAVADDDGEKLSALLRQITTGEVGVISVVVQLAQIAGELMQQVSGDGWRSELNVALLGIAADEDLGTNRG